MSRPSRLSRALTYAVDHERRVFPIWEAAVRGVCSCDAGAKCERIGKHPRTTNGVKDATRERQQVTTWWRRWPSANIGMAIETDEVLVDVDGPPGRASLKALEAELGSLPIGPMWRTGREDGGRQRLFRLAPGVRIANRNGVLPGIDLKTRGGYGIVPDSLHESGRTYEDIEGRTFGDLAIPLLPAAWCERLRELLDATNGSAVNECGTVSRGDLVDDADGPIVHGHRHEDLFRYACSLRARRADEAEILSALRERNGRCVDGEGHPDPEHDHELRRLARDVVNRYAPGPSAGRDSSQTLNPYLRAHAIGSSMRSIRKPGSTTPSTTLAGGIALPIRSLAEPARTTADEFLTAYIPKAAITLVHGDPAVGKSVYVFDQVRSLLAGDRYLGERTIQSSVLYLSERPERVLRPELARCGIPDTHTFNVLYVSDVIGRSWEELIEGAKQACTHDDIGLVIIDSFAAFAQLEGEEENQAAVVTSKLQTLRRLTEVGITVIVVHHDKKIGGTGASRIRGSGAFAAACDNLLGVSRVEGNRPRVRRITCIGHFPEIAETTDLVLTEGYRYERAVSPGTVVLRALRSGAETLGDVAQASGLSRATAHRALKTLVEKRKVVRDGSGKRGDGHRYRLSS